MKKNLIVIKNLSASLSDIDTDLIRQIRLVLIKSDADDAAQKIGEVIDEKAAMTTSKASSGSSHANIAFGVRPGVDPMLDVARATYKEVIEDIYREVVLYKEAAPELAGMKLIYTVGRGYHLVVFAESEENLPEAFVQRKVKGKKVFCTTNNLLSLDSRRRECFAEILRISYQVIEKMISTLRQHIHWFQLVSEAVALLDMITSFASLAMQRPGYIKPEITKDGPLAVQEGRHPVVELLSPEKFTPNEIFQTEHSNFFLITGPNASGKSTYLKQVCVLIVMAHIGSYIPASFASFRVIRSIFTRFPSESEIEESRSTFAREMSEISHMIKNVDRHSFVAIDELGRDTSTADGISIAWAVAECLADKSCASLFTTHYFELTRLAEMYPNIKHKILKVNITEKRAFHYSFQVINNADSSPSKEVNNYGIRIAESAGFPLQVTDNAKRISRSLRDRLGHNEERGSGVRAKAFLLMDQLLGLKFTSLEPPQIKQILEALQEANVGTIDDFLGGNKC